MQYLSVTLLLKMVKQVYDTLCEALYEEIRRKISKDLDKDQKITFLQEIPSQINVCSSLYKYRREFIPVAPNEYVSSFMNALNMK